ncbi:MAG TPA: NHL repeat-containing protein [bacterium]|nr:NHL repeat-containing protein [bacterium]
MGRVLVAAFIVICAVEAWNLFTNKPPKPFQVQRLLDIIPAKSSCGPFNAWGVSPIGKDRILVVDQGGNRLLVFDRQGNCVKSWGKAGTSTNQFREPSSAVSDGKGNAYVIDTWNTSIKGFDENGKPVGYIDLSYNKNFYGPRGLSMAGKNFLVADTGNHRIVVVSPEGNILAVFGKKGNGKGEFEGPQSVCMDSKGGFLVADTENGRLQWLDQDGKVQKMYKFTGSVNSVTVDKQGRFYVANGDNAGCIKVYSPSGNLLGNLVDEKGSGDSFHSIRSMVVDPNNVLMTSTSDLVALYQLPSGNP